ncbi:MAG: hypothetical protein Q9224_007105 [Gallowayella concinna]
MSPKPIESHLSWGMVVKDEALLRWFLEHGANPNAQAETCDVTPLSYAVQRASFDNIQLMFASGGSTARGQLLNMASGRTDPNCVPVMQYLFDHGDTGINSTYCEDRPEPEPWSGLCNQTPLHHAASSGNIEAVKWLLKHGANPTKRTKCRDRLGDLPHEAALHKHHIEIVNLLIRAIVDRQEKESPAILSNDIKNTIAELYRNPYLSEPLENSHGKVTSSGDNYALQNYSMLLMLLEQERKRRSNLACRDQGDITEAEDGLGGKLARAADNDDKITPEEKELQRMLEEQHAKKKALMARAA